MMRDKETQSGFSLVETLVAITILLLVIIGPLTIMSSTANSTSFASDQVTAFFLAQEGLELAQKARDEIVMRRFFADTDPAQELAPWPIVTDQSGIFADCFTTTGCGLTDNSSAGGSEVIDCSSGGCDIWFDSGAGRLPYGYHGSGDLTDYRREIYFENVGPAVQVRSVVTWFPSGSRNENEVEAETYLYDVYVP